MVGLGKDMDCGRSGAGSCRAPEMERRFDSTGGVMGQFAGAGVGYLMSWMMFFSAVLQCSGACESKGHAGSGDSCRPGC